MAILNKMYIFPDFIMNCHIKAVHSLLHLLANSVGDGLWAPMDGIWLPTWPRGSMSHTPLLQWVHRHV